MLLRPRAPPDCDYPFPFLRYSVPPIIRPLTHMASTFSLAMSLTTTAMREFAVRSTCSSNVARVRATMVHGVATRCNVLGGNASSVATCRVTPHLGCCMHLACGIEHQHRRESCRTPWCRTRTAWRMPGVRAMLHGSCARHICGTRAAYSMQHIDAQTTNARAPLGLARAEEARQYRHSHARLHLKRNTVRGRFGSRRAASSDTLRRSVFHGAQLLAAGMILALRIRAAKAAYAPASDLSGRTTTAVLMQSRLSTRGAAGCMGPSAPPMSCPSAMRTRKTKTKKRKENIQKKWMLISKDSMDLSVMSGNCRRWLFRTYWRTALHIFVA